MVTKKPHLSGVWALLPAVAGMSALQISVSPVRAQSPTNAPYTDMLNFGSPSSETGHSVTAENSEIAKGALGQMSRVLEPTAVPTWQGGSVSFVMAVDPDKINYFTARFWGGEANIGRLVLKCEGKQVGAIHIGDIELLDFGNDEGQKPLVGRFFYKTTPLPLSLTRGKHSVHLSIQGIGRVWGYGNDFAQFQRTMTETSRGLYSVYVHTDGYFVPPADEVQGSVPAHPPVRQVPGPEVIARVKDRVEQEIKRELESKQPLNQMQIQFLARAYSVPWTSAFGNAGVIAAVAHGLDSIYAHYRVDDTLMKSDPSTPNPDWFGFGPAGDAVWRLQDQLRPMLLASIDDGKGGTVVRRDAWADMLRASVDWNSRHRRQYTNQSIIIDMNIYTATRGVEALGAKTSLTDSQAMHYLYQSVGLEPWLGSETDHGPEKPLGDHYMELTSAGLSKELGYVGYYGEIIDWLAQVYDVTRPKPNLPGDPKIKAQLAKIMHARAVFRYPDIDNDSDAAMRVETLIGWRDDHFPSAVTYAERPSWDGSSLFGAACAPTDEAVGSVQQIIADNQLYESIKSQMGQNYSLRVTNGLLGIPVQLEQLQAKAPVKNRLPMSHGQPNFVFADPEDGVVAIKNGSEIVYASLYWRARHSINFLARVHDIGPHFDRIATVHEDETFKPSGMTFVRPDNIVGTSGWGVHYPADLHSAEAGETEPIAEIPADEKFHPGDENVHAGRAQFYKLRYGPYLIAMNTTNDMTYDVAIPAGPGRAWNLVNGKRVKPGTTVKVKPLATSVFYVGQSLP